MVRIAGRLIRVILVDLIFVLQRGETVLSQADHGLFLTSSDEAKRC